MKIDPPPFKVVLLGRRRSLRAFDRSKKRTGFTFLREFKLHMKMGYNSLGPNEELVWFDAAGKIHREDGPAMITKEGYMTWWSHGVAGRSDITKYSKLTPDGMRTWKSAGKLHREDGPAIVSKDGCCWFLEDEPKPNHDRPNYVAFRKSPLGGTASWLCGVEVKIDV